MSRRPSRLRTRFRVLQRCGFACFYCGRRPPEAVLEIDHRVPRAAGGTDDEDNLIAACTACNNGKGDLLLQQQYSCAHRPPYILVGGELQCRCGWLLAQVPA